MNKLETQICPNCKNILQINVGFITWCEKCDWNLESTEKEHPETAIQKLLLCVGKKYGKSLIDSLASSKPKKLKMTFSIAYLIDFAPKDALHTKDFVTE